MITVIDQAKPWLMPSSALAATTQSQLGAHMIMNGTGRPTSQPRTSTRLRPHTSAQLARDEVGERLDDAEADDEGDDERRRGDPNSSRADQRHDRRSMPTMPPTKALTSDEQRELRQFSRRPSRMPEGFSEAVMS